MSHATAPSNTAWIAVSLLLATAAPQAGAGVDQKAAKILKKGKAQALKEYKASIKALEKQLAAQLKVIDVSLAAGQSGTALASDLFDVLEAFQVDMQEAGSAASDAIRLAVTDAFGYLQDHGITESQAPEGLRYGAPGPLADVFRPFRAARDKRYRSVNKRLAKLSALFPKKAGLGLRARVRAPSDFRESYLPPSGGVFTSAEALTIDLAVAFSHDSSQQDGTIRVSGTTHKASALTLELFSGTWTTHPVSGGVPGQKRWTGTITNLAEKNYTLRIAPSAGEGYEHLAIYVP